MKLRRLSPKIITTIAVIAVILISVFLSERQSHAQGDCPQPPFSITPTDPDPDLAPHLAKARKYVREFFEIGDFSDKVLDAALGERFEGVTFLWWVGLLMSADKVYESIAKDRYADALYEASNQLSKLALVNGLSLIGLHGVGVAASLAALPIEWAFEDFIKTAKKLAFQNQFELYMEVRRLGYPHEFVLAGQNIDNPDTILFSDPEKWLYLVIPHDGNPPKKIPSYGPAKAFGASRKEVYAMACTLWNLKQHQENYIEDYLQDKAQLKQSLQQVLASSCSITVGDKARNSQPFIESYNRNGGKERVGCPVNSVHLWGKGYVQDFDDGSDGKGILMLRKGTDTAYWLYGSIWEKYESIGGAKSWLGFPISDVFVIHDGYPRSDFEKGYITTPDGINYYAYSQSQCPYTLTVEINPQEAGRVIKSPDKDTYCRELITLTALPNSGFSFKNWSEVDSSDGTTATLTMNKNRTVTANFVKATKTVCSVTITPSSWTFTSPGAKQLTATANYCDNTTEDVTNKATWTSSNSNVATVSNSGLVTSGQNGSAVITASYGGKSGTRTVTVDIINETYVIKIGAEADSIHFPSQRKLAVTSDGHLHVVYHSKDRSGILQIYHAESPDGGRTWVEEQLTQAPKDQWFPALAVDSKDNLHLVWQDDAIKPGTVPSTYYKKKTTDWQVAEFVASYATTPAIAIDSSDDVHVVYGVYVYPPGYYGGGNGIRWRKRTSSGWQPEESISSEKYWAEVPAAAIDGDNNIHVVWSHAPRAYYYDIHYRIRTSSGWESEVQINTETTNEIGSIPSIAIDGKNFVHVVWHHESGGYYTIKYRKYTSSWEPTEDLDTTPYQQYEPTIALDSKDHIHVVWSGQHSGSPTHFQIRYREYTTSWQPIENLTSSISSDQTNPNLLWAFYPTVNGVKTNQPEDGYSFIWMDGTTIKYW